MRYLILIIPAIFFSLTGFSSAQIQEGPVDAGKLDKIYQQIEEKALQPMKQLSERLSENIGKSFKNFVEKIKQEKHQKQEEIKEEVKKEVKKEAQEWGQGLGNWIKDRLSPLKIKFQEGSKLLREGINQIKNRLINLL